MVDIAANWYVDGLPPMMVMKKARTRTASPTRVILNEFNLARIRRPYWLTSHDGGVSDGINLSTFSGAAQIVMLLQGIWPTAERVADRHSARLTQGRG